MALKHDQQSVAILPSDKNSHSHDIDEAGMEQMSWAICASVGNLEVFFYNSRMSVYW
jgi:hypothetical protein